FQRWLPKSPARITPPAIPIIPTVRVSASATVAVTGTQWGKSTCYIGAVEGSSRFALSDFKDLGINTYHIYGGMSRWEAQDDSRVYGSPSIAQIKANPNVINWVQWDTVMTHPPDGSDYWWVGASPSWSGNASTLFASLKAAGIQPIVTLRNRDDQQHPSWAPNPPTTQADWNEWWEHVFATVYWLNVRNTYTVNDFEAHNEPDNINGGWKGTQAQYITFLQYTHDAIDYVYKTYLPGRTYHLYAPATTTGSDWPNALLQQTSDAFDSLDIHDYSWNISTEVKQAHNWLNAHRKGNDPVWISEWGSYAQDEKYNTVPLGISLINNLIRGSRPGDDYVYGSHIFSLYDYGTLPLGLISYKGTRRADYYAVRLAIRALQGCRPTYQSTTSDPNLLAMTTRDAKGGVSFLVTNQDRQKNYRVTVDLSALISGEKGTIWQFDTQYYDQVVGSAVANKGRVTLTLPANGALLVKFGR
ncbi:MAG TPA: hypothetical protein VHV10_19760, partial [Ktedonobacteraceae bacterium]|nr:hypothetical protein [Ktedonobacteraceae bacterium]